MVLSQDGRLLATIGEDNALKLFEVTSFDMTCMIKLKFKPLQEGWATSNGPFLASKRLETLRRAGNLYQNRWISCTRRTRRPRWWRCRTPSAGRRPLSFEP